MRRSPEPAWKGRLCLRTSKKVYNQSLVAMMIATHGEPKTEQIVRGWVANLATDVFANDTQLLEAIAAGPVRRRHRQHLLLRPHRQGAPDFPVRLFWANQGAGGTHVNISGCRRRRGTRATPAAATRFLEWLSVGQGAGALRRREHGVSR